MSVVTGASFRIGEVGTEGSDDSTDLPFSAELGQATGYAGGFAVGALTAASDGTRAVVALVGSDGASGRIVALGPSYGGAAPPHLVARGRELFLVAPASDASGATLRLGVMRDPGGTADVTWGAELSEGWDESQAYDVLVRDKRGLVAWDRWARPEDHSEIVVASFDASDVSSSSPPRTVSGKEENAESPRLVGRPGGSWLAYLLVTPEPAEDAGVSASKALDEGTGMVVDLGRRSLVAMPLDEVGKPLAPPRLISPKDDHVIAFDLAPANDGGALLVWRNDQTSPGVESGTLHLANVMRDGSVRHRALEGENVGSGTPTLIANTADGKHDVTWLAVSTTADRTELLALSPDGTPRGRLEPDPTVGRGDVLAQYADRMIVGTPRGRGIELSVVRCSAAATQRP